MGSKLDAALKEISKNYGKGVVTKAAEMPEMFRIPTGIATLDADLGGGIPKSRMTLLIGEPSGSKTTTALMTAANMQQHETLTNRPLVKMLDEEREPQNFEGLLIPYYKYYDKVTGEEKRPGVVIFIDLEGTFDRTWAMALGVDLNEMEVVRSDFQEQAYDIVHGLIKTAEVDLIIVDSVAAMTPGKELDVSAEDDLPGLQARKNGQGMRKMMALLNQVDRIEAENNVTAPAVIMINQKRLKIGVMYGNPETTPGGRSLDFYAAVKIDFRPDNKNAIKDKDEVIAKAFAYSITKNKMNGRQAQGGFKVYSVDTELYRRGQANSYDQVFDLAIRMGLVVQEGSMYQFLDQRIRGKDNALKTLLEIEGGYEQIKNEVVGRLGA